MAVFKFQKRTVKRRSDKSLATKCNKYVAIQSHVRVKDGEGGFTKDWSTITGFEEVPVAIWPVGAKRVGEYRTVNVNASHEILMRGEIDIVIESNHRFYFPEENKYYEIETDENIQSKGEQKLFLCLERRV